MAKPDAAEPPVDRPIPTWLLVSWALTGALLAFLALLSIRQSERASRAEWESRLSHHADDRAVIAEQAVNSWRREARRVAGLESVRAFLADASSPALMDRVRRDLADSAAEERGLAIGVLDPAGRPRAASAASASFDETDAAPARQAVAEGREILAHPIHAGHHTLDLQVAAPVADAAGRAAGAVLLAVDAANAMGAMFPQPTGPDSERLFVVVQEGDRFLVVAPERQKDPDAAYRLAATDPTTFAAAALARPRASGEYSDGRGRRVLAAARRVPGINWAVVVEVDRDVVLRGLYPKAVWIVLAAAALFAAVTGAGLAWRRTMLLRHLEQLSDRDRRYKTLLEQTQEAVSVGIDGKVAYANPACVDMFGYARPLVGVPVSIFFAPGSREQVEEIVRHRAAGRPAPKTYEAVGLRADGSTFDVELRVTPITFDGKAGSQAVLRDITGRKRMEAGLRESEERYRLLFERNLAGVYRSTPDGRLLECNRAFARMMGYASPAEAMAQSAGGSRGASGARPDFLERLRREGSLVSYESQGRRKDGSTIWLIENVSLIRDEDGEEVLLGTVFDMTERRRLEEQLLQSQKMEAVGRLAGGIAHDFNNLLTAIAGYSALLLEQLPEGDARRESAEEIREAGRRAAGLTQQLLAFSRRQVLEPRVLDLNAVIAGMEKMLRRVIGEDVELTTALDPGLWRTLADPGQIEQAIVNLAVNARDAMPRGGRLTLETGNVTLDEKFASGYATVHPGPHVMLAVSDTGVGMDATLQTRLFEPFFTTKERGKGTGLGLSTTYGIVKQSGGSIWVYSEPGHGTTFKIYLPRCDEPLDAREPAPPPAKPRPGTETVLLVEDEPEVRRLVEKLLRMQGYAVLSAGSPAEAVAAAKAAKDEIAILVTDVIMPGMNGRELARVLAADRPAMRVLYMSGYTDAAIAHQGILPPGTAFLSKPFTPDALARKVREVLDEPAAS